MGKIHLSNPNKPGKTWCGGRWFPGDTHDPGKATCQRCKKLAEKLTAKPFTS